MQNQSNTRIAFIGAGNMAASLIQGLLRKGFDPASIHAADPAADQLARLAGLGIHTYTDNADATREASIVVLAVKPQLAGAVLRALTLTDDQVLVSIAAGIDLRSLMSWTRASQPIVRCMPNTPALVGAGISALFASKTTSEPQRDGAEAVLGAAGDVLWVDTEAQLDAVTAVSGSGPAYFFYLMEAMVDSGEKLGLSRETATRLTLQTAYGAAVMARDGEDPPATLRRNVTSPGGTTAAALATFDAADMAATIDHALAAAAHRAVELAREFGTETAS